MSVIIVLAGHGRENYLINTITSLENAGALESHFDLKRYIYYISPNDEIPRFPKWETVHCRRDLAGSTKDTWEVFYFAWQNCNLGYSEKVLFFEDDIIAGINAVRLMHQLNVPERCALTTYFDQRRVNQSRYPTIIETPANSFDGRGHWGNQAMVFPARTIKWLAERAIPQYEQVNFSDVALGRELMKSPWPKIAHFGPTMFKHVGEISLANAGMDLSAKLRSTPENFKDDYDVMTELRFLNVGQLVYL